MNYTVLVVDDSIFHRRRLKEMIEEDARLKVIDAASNGKEAILKAKELSPDIITMDVEMPVLDGISAVKQIMQHQPVPLLMFSSLTAEGADQTLDALDAGAVDFLLKEFDNKFNPDKDVGFKLRSKILTLVRKRHTLKRQTRDIAKLKNAPKTFIRAEKTLVTAPVAEPVKIISGVVKSGKTYKCLAIGASTGGPVALQKTLAVLPASFPYPIFLVQHMPGSFTEAFAQRLNQTSNVSVKLAKDGEKVQPGVAYLAPGGRQMLLKGTSSACTIRITDIEDDGRILYKPSVDLTFFDIAKVYGGDVLALILTGMGSDGTEACTRLKRLGATIWAQDEKSSVVYGMPGAVTKAKVAQVNIDLEHISQCIKSEMV